MIKGRKRHASGAVDAALNAIRALNVSTSYPLVLWLLAARQDGGLDDAGLVRCLQMISSFVEAALRTFLEGKGWPDDDRFTPAFIKIDLYQSKYCRAVLDGLELSQQRESERVALDRDAREVERGADRRARA